MKKLLICICVLLTSVVPIAATAQSVGTYTEDNGAIKNNIGTYTVNKGGTTLNTNQVSAGTTATLITAARSGRQKVTFAVQAANTCAFGPAGVALTTGFALQPVAGASVTFDTSAAVYAVCNVTTTIAYAELY